MRYRIALLLIVLLLLTPRGLSAQEQKEEPAAKPADTRAADLLAELSKATYTAKRAIPASDGIFVENGRVMEAVYNLQREDHGIAVPAGKTAAITKVVLLERALQVFFADDKCALLILPKGEQKVEDMQLPALLELARQGIGALFTSKATNEAPKPGKVSDGTGS